MLKNGLVVKVEANSVIERLEEMGARMLQEGRTYGCSSTNSVAL